MLSQGLQVQDALAWPQHVRQGAAGLAEGPEGPLA